MGIKGLLKRKIVVGGSLVRGHVLDALKRKEKTGRSFRECLDDSIKETFSEDLPVTSQMSKNDDRILGSIEQAERDEKNMREMHESHEHYRREWEE